MSHNESIGPSVRVFVSLGDNGSQGYREFLNYAIEDGRVELFHVKHAVGIADMLALGHLSEAIELLMGSIGAAIHDAVTRDIKVAFACYSLHPCIVGEAERLGASVIRMPLIPATPEYAGVAHLGTGAWCHWVTKHGTTTDRFRLALLTRMAWIPPYAWIKADVDNLQDLIDSLSNNGEKPLAICCTDLYDMQDRPELRRYKVAWNCAVEHCKAILKYLDDKRQRELVQLVKSPRVTSVRVKSGSEILQVNDFDYDEATGQVTLVIRQ
jgi:hypothetical protein